MTDRHDATTRRVFRALVLITALANAGGNVFILLFYRPILHWVGAPLPVDVFSFTFVCGFSFTVGILAWMIYRNPEDNLALIVAVILGKGVYAGFTFYFYYVGELHWFYRVFGVWDSCYAAIFFLFLIHLVSPDLTRLNRGEVLASGDPTPRTRKAVIIYFSMSGNGTRAVQRVKAGLTAEGYEVAERLIEVGPVDQALFRFPFQKRLAFLRIMLRAIFRIPVAIRPLALPANHDYDLIVVESQTWFVGMSAPVEAVFQDPANRPAFAGRDVAVINVCRGLWRRPQAMLVRWIEACGGHVVGARALANPGREPIRTFSLFFFLGAGGVGRPAFLSGVLTPQFLSSEALGELELFGRGLALRAAAPAAHARAGGM
jgi:flavodoxin